MNDKARMDLRVIKTKRAIRSAFTKLLSAKDFNSITVKDIAESAEVNRKTFYSYYAGVSEIAGEFEDKVASAFGHALTDLDLSHGNTVPHEIFKKLSSVIDENREFYKRIMNTSRAAIMLTKLIDELGKKIRVQLSRQTDKKDKSIDLAVGFTAAGMITAYQNWFDSDRSETMDELSNKVSAIAFSGINGLMQS